MSKIDFGDFKLRNISHMFKLKEADSIILYGSTLERIDLVINQAKIKQTRRTKYEHITKVKLLDSDLPPVEVVEKDNICKVKASEEFLIVVFEMSNIVKIFSSLTSSTSFVSERETLTIIDLAMEKNGNLIGIAYDTFDV